MFQPSDRIGPPPAEIRFRDLDHEAGKLRIRPRRPVPDLFPKSLPNETCWVISESCFPQACNIARPLHCFLFDQNYSLTGTLQEIVRIRDF